MAQETVINVHGLPMDWKRPTKSEFHGTTYMEYEIPKKLEKELTKMVGKRLKEFYKECKCDSCKRRKNKK